MLSKKILSLGLTALLSASLSVGCGSEFDSTEYLDEQGKQLIKQYENREKYNYIKVESLEPFVSEDMYKDKYIMMTGKVTDIKEEGQACYEISFDFEENHTIDFIRVFINKNMIDVKFNKGDTITVYGRCNGIQTKRYGDESFDYWHISAYFLELGDTTNKDINTKDTAIKETKDDKDVATEIQPQKKVTVNVSEQASDKPDNTPKDTNQNETKSTQKKSNENTTKEEPSNKHKCWLCKKNITNENFGGYSEDGTMICYRCLNKYGKDKPKEEPVYNEYGYDQYGNYDPNKDLNNDREWNDEDYERWYDIYGDEEEDYDDYSEEPIQEADDVE